MDIDSLEFRSKIAMCIDKAPKNVKDISDITDSLLILFKEQLLIQRVSQQRELLAFRKWQKDNWKNVYLYSDEFMISEFKKANCG